MKLTRQKSIETRVEMRFLEQLDKRCPKNSRILTALGDLYSRDGRHHDGLRVDLQLARLRPSECEVWYNLACSYALVGQKEDAFSALFKAVDLGYDDFEWMNRDTDLSAIRNDPRFKLLVRDERT